MPVGRVTYRSMQQNTMLGVTASLGRVQDLQNQLSSGKRVSRAGDDPGAASASLLLRNQHMSNQQYMRNIDESTGRLQSADEALQGLADRIRRAKELVLTAKTGSASDVSRSGIAADLNGIADDIKDLFNASWLGRPVFGGTVQGGKAIDTSTGAYLGNEKPITARISRDATIRVDVSGQAAGADTLPAAIAQAVNDVINNPGALDSSLTALDDNLKKVLTSMGDVGARASRLEATRQHVEYESQDFTQRISEFEDADLAETIMNLQSQQVAYQAALGAASKVMQQSLMDFLR